MPLLLLLLAGGFVVYKVATATPAPAPGSVEGAPKQLFKPSDFDLSKALNFVLDTSGKTATVRPGTSIQFSKNVGGLSWADPGVTSSNPSVLAPSVPTTITGFIAVGEGAAVVNGYYFDDAGQLAKLTATIVVSASA